MTLNSFFSSRFWLYTGIKPGFYAITLALGLVSVAAIMITEFLSRQCQQLVQKYGHLLPFSNFRFSRAV